MVGAVYDQLSEGVMRSNHPIAVVGLALFLAVSSVFATGEERYYGGSFDGNADDILLQSEVIELGSRFAGGACDGYGDWLLLQSDPVELGVRFAGGSYDGQDDAAITNQPNPLLFDSDGDELVDWWELAYLGNLAGLYGLGDYDGDGATDFHELMADTIPTDTNSLFRITEFIPASPIRVVFTCVDSRIYSLESTLSLTTDAWFFVSGQTNVPGEADGSMLLTDTNAAPFRAYRVRVMKP